MGQNFHKYSTNIILQLQLISDSKNVFFKLTIIFIKFVPTVRIARLIVFASLKIDRETDATQPEGEIERDRHAYVPHRAWLAPIFSYGSNL